MIPPDTVRAVDTVRAIDTVWVAIRPEPAGFVELATAWSTVAVALFALATLFLPWWDRRRRRATVDAQVAGTAHAIGGLVASLQDEVLIRSRDDSFDWAKPLARDAAACRDRIVELAVLARDGSPEKAKAATDALVTITQVTYGFEMLARLNDGPVSLYHQQLSARNVLAAAETELPLCLHQLQAAENADTLAIWHRAAEASLAEAEKVRAERAANERSSATAPEGTAPTTL